MTNEVTERPILYQGAMIRALLAGLKTQTRRVMKPQPTLIKVGDSVIQRGVNSTIMSLPMRDETSEGLLARCPGGRLAQWFNLPPAQDDLCRAQSWTHQTPASTFKNRLAANVRDARRSRTSRYGGGNTQFELGELLPLCPYGRPGDRLYARESFKVAVEPHGDDGAYWCEYFADGARFEMDGSEVKMGRITPGKSYPSIHMPRWVSRIRKEVTEVRIERISEISEADAIAEGLSLLSKDGGIAWKYGIPDRDGLPGGCDEGWEWRDWCVDPREAYRKLWDSINAKPKPVTGPDKRVTHYISFPWAGEARTETHRGKPHIITPNPWVFVVSFNVLEGAGK